MTRSTSGRVSQPVREREPLPLGLAQPQIHACAGRASARNTSSGPGGIAIRSTDCVQPREPFRIGRDEPEQQVGMAGEIFGAGLDRHVDAMRVRRERRAASPRCCP